MNFEKTAETTPAPGPPRRPLTPPSAGPTRPAGRSWLPRRPARESSTFRWQPSGGRWPARAPTTSSRSRPSLPPFRSTGFASPLMSWSALRAPEGTLGSRAATGSLPRGSWARRRFGAGFEGSARRRCGCTWRDVEALGRCAEKTTAFLCLARVLPSSTTCRATNIFDLSPSFPSLPPSLRSPSLQRAAAHVVIIKGPSSCGGHHRRNSTNKKNRKKEKSFSLSSKNQNLKQKKGKPLTIFFYPDFDFDPSFMFHPSPSLPRSMFP